MSRTICEHKTCTGCAACRDICPKHCITMEADAMDATFPVIDESTCINCGLCDKTCPNNRQMDYRYPQKVWVAWSNDEEVRRTSASGGVAYELCRYWINKGGVATGVVFDREKGCYFVLVEKFEDIQPTQNSKYTFSDTDGIYRAVKEKLQSGIPVLFIGVPCQVAGLRGYLKKDCDNLITVDLICHGMPPSAYLQQHMEFIEHRKRERTSELFFRDPKYNTNTFTFTLRNKDGKEFYNKKVLNTDNYQLGYHHALIYRDNCYQCRYARKERITDLTIGDFSGLGKFATFEYEKSNTNCILQNTDKGAKLLANMQAAISIYERPDKEAFEVEMQLKAPSVRHSRRAIFESEYKSSHDFECSADVALRKEKMRVTKTRFILTIKNCMRSIIPQRVLSLLNRKNNHGNK